MNKDLVDLVKQLEKNEKELLKKKEKLSQMQKGCIFIRKMGNQYYVYRKYRVGNKVVSKYIAPLRDKAAKQAIKDQEEYNKLKFSVSKLKKDLNNMKKEIKKRRKENEDILKFAEIVNSVDAGPISNKTRNIIRLFLDGAIDAKAAESLLLEFDK